MNNDIKVVEIEEHEDGSATLQVECDPETFAEIFNYGFVQLIRNGIEATTPPLYRTLEKEERAKIGKHLRDHYDEVYADIRNFNDEERNRARERAEKNKDSSVDTDNNKLE
jgi:hypothetical protein